MAPEQAKGKPVDRRADIWAFGCVLYEMLTGHRAFEGEDVTDTIAAVVTREPEWSRLPASTPPSVERLLRRCLDKQTAKRLPHIGVARLELGEMPAERVSSSNTTRGHQAPRPGGKCVGRRHGNRTGGLASLAGDASCVAPAPMHVAVPMPSPTAAANGLLLSPDGRVPRNAGAGGASMLHAFDGSPSQALEGVVGCWSPDSRSLALLRANEELVRMDVAGGRPSPSRKDAPHGRGLFLGA